MADRLVSVTVRAVVSDFLSGMDKVQKATEQTTTAAQKLEKQQQAFDKVGKAILTVGAAAAAAVVLAVKSFADFDAQMSQVQSLSHATAAEMDQLRNAALTMGQGIGFSATQVADAETELVKAGIGVKDIMGGALKGALDLAAAGQIDVAQATEIASSAMTQFGLSGKDVPHVADLLAAAADKSLGGVSDLGMALKQSGLVASQFGLTIDDTVGTLAEFAKAGLMGSDAGTSLKQMFLQLASPSQQAADVMKSVGFSAYDAQGNFIGITKLAGELKDKFSDMSAQARNSALSIIFGSDAIRAANILYKDGATGNQKWINSVNDAGFAAQQAAGKTDNLNGDVKKLSAALQTDLIKSGSASNDILRTLTQNVTGFAHAFGDAPEAVQGVALGLTALVAATALAGGGFLTMVPKIAAAKAAMADLQLTGASLARGFGVGGAIALGVYAISAGIAGLGTEAQLTDVQISKLNASLTAKSTNAINTQFVGGGGAFDMIGTKATNAKQALDALTSGLGPTNIAVGKFFDGIFKTGTADTAERFAAQFKEIGTVLSTTAQSDLPSATTQFNRLLTSMGGGQDTAKKLLDQLSPYKAELIELAGAQGKTLNSTQLLNLAQGKGELAAELAASSTAKQNEKLSELTGVAATAKTSISDLSNEIKEFGSTQLDVDSTERDFRQSVDDASKALADNGTSIDAATGKFNLLTQAGRDNSAALDGIASSGIKATAAIVDNGGTQADAAAKMQETRDAYIKAAEAFGISADQAGQMADQLKLIPDNVTTLFQTPGADDAKSSADAVKGAVDAVPTGKSTTLAAKIDDAQAKLSALQAQYGQVPANKATKFLADVAAATADVNRLKSAMDQIRDKYVTITTNMATTGGKVVPYATGGRVFGPGSGTSDSIPARLSNGEYVVKASSVTKYGSAMLDAINSQRFASGGIVRAVGQYARAGQVQYVQSAPGVSVAAAPARQGVRDVHFAIQSNDADAIVSKSFRRLDMLGA